jgi:hypothetical protein
MEREDESSIDLYGQPEYQGDTRGDLGDHARDQAGDGDLLKFMSFGDRDGFDERWTQMHLHQED